MQTMDKETIQLKDWSGFSVFGGPSQVYAPANEEEVSRLVRCCSENGQRLRVVGRQTSWSNTWYCDEAMMTTSRLNSITKIDKSQQTITCGSGVTLTDVHRALWDNGLTLNAGPAVGWVTVGGAVSTGSHGSGHASVSSRMTSCRLVTANGQVIEIGEGDERLDAVRISLGLLGVLTSVTLKAESAFDVKLTATRIPTKDWSRFLKEGEMSYVLCFPHTGHSVLMRADKLDQASLGQGGGYESPPATSLDTDFKRARHEIGKLALRVPSTFPARNRYLLDVYFPDFTRSGPAHEVLMSYTSEPIAGCEWAVPVKQFDAAFNELLHESEQAGMFLPVVWLKKVVGETAWLRAADAECIQCGVYHDVIDGVPSPVEAMVRRVERIMLRHGGRPHLGKLIYLEPEELKQAYLGWSGFDILRRRMDPQGMFWSKSVAARFGVQ